jgi:hypothetical protein
VISLELKGIFMVVIGRSAKLYQERRQPVFQQTLRSPGPQIYLPDNPVNDLPLEPPLPSPEIKRIENCTPVDTTLTQVWPYGDKYE